MDKTKWNLAAIGLLTVVAAVLFVWGLFYLMGNPIWRGGTDIVLVLDDGGGLKRGDRVHLNGVPVGTVRDVRLQGPGEVKVDLRLEEGIILPSDTRAVLKTDVFGSNTVVLRPGASLVRLEEGDTIRGAASPVVVDLVAELSDRAKSLMSSADSLLSAEALAGVHATAAILPATAEELRRTFQELHLAAISLRRSAEGVEQAETGQALANALEELQGTARAFSAAANAMEASLGSMASVLGKIDMGHGTLGRLVNDTTLYHELYGTLREVRLLATDLREHPKRYLNISLF